MHTTYEAIDGRPALCFDRRIAHPVEAVWGAITEPAELEQWFPTAVAGEMRAGGELIFTFVKHDIPPMTGAVTDYDPPTLLAFYWGEDQLRFELSPADGGAQTDLRLTVLLDSADKAARDGAGWHTCLDRLAASLDGSDADALEAINDGWRERYDDYAGRGFPATAPIPETAS